MSYTLFDERADAAEQDGEVYLFPASFAQRRLWLLNQIEPDNPFYNTSTVLRLDGQLDVAALGRVLAEVVRRHEVLRTTFELVDGEPTQVVTPRLRVPLPLIDLSGLPGERREAEARRLTAEETARPFDLERGPLVRAALLRMGAEDHIAFFTMHHIVSDAWSKFVLVAEVSALYEAYRRGLPSPLPELPVQYADFAVWQREYLQGEVLERQLDYWRQRFAGAHPVLQLPTDRPRPPVQTYRGATELLSLPEGLAERLTRLGQREGATLFMVLLAAFDALLARYTGQEDIVVGTPVAGRTRAETEPLIGFFINTLALRTDLSGNPTFRELLARVREVCLGAYAHQDVPFDLLVEELQPERDLSRNPLFQVAFVIQNAPADSLELSGLRLSTPLLNNRTAKFDLTLQALAGADSLHTSLEYNSDLFDAATARRMLEHFARLLEALAADPDARIDDLPLLSGEERRQLTAGFNGTATEYPREATLHELFAEQAAAKPEAVAVVFGDESLTYAELDARADRLARRLRSHGVGPDSLVGLFVGRSAEMVVALLGILKAGGAYLPLDPEYPAERLSFMLEDARPRVLLTTEELAGRLPEHGARVLLLEDEARAVAHDDVEGEEKISVGVTHDNMAYVTYTSGSTGTPKGVSVTHRNVIRLVRGNWFAPLDGSDTVLQMAPLAFDASTFEIWGALLNGARLAVMEPGRSSLEELEAAVTRYGVTALWLTAGLFHLVVDERPAGLRPLRRLLAGGDALSGVHVRRALEVSPGLVLVNGYGPTENTTFSCCHMMESGVGLGQAVPIGRPIANSTAYVLDGQLEPTPMGVAGELYVGGDGVARGYLNRPALTAERFVPDPFAEEPGARLYRTGDVARWTAGGEIEFLGRVDHQVKVRGFRVEPEEIEAALGQHPCVSRCAVVVKAGEAGDKLLAAYFVAGRDGGVTEEDLRLHLSRSLPEYMVPSLFVPLEEMPLTPNGKVDRRALAARFDERPAAEYVAPRGAVEQAVADAFAEVLGLERVGAQDNFFRIGGHSLSATRVVSRLRSAVGAGVALRDLFEAPTPAALAARVAPGAQPPGGDGARLSRREHREGAPLSYAQQRLWFIDQLEPGSAAYNVPIAFRLKGELDVAVLRRTLSEIVRRHESLRTTFASVDGRPVHVIHEPAEVPLPLTDLTGLDEARREAAARCVVEEEARRPFDLTRGPLFGARLLRLGAREHMALVNMHHIVSDGWSLGVLVRETAALYEAFSRGLPSPLPELPVQYADFAAWQREHLQGEALEAHLDYWRRQLAGAPPAVELASGAGRPERDAGQRSARRSAVLGPELTRRLRELSELQGATLFMVLLAAFDALLSRYTGQEDIVVGTPVAGRTQAELEPLIGFFVNNLVLRTDLSGDPTFGELIARVRETALGAYAHQEVPFDRLVEELQPERDLNRHPLFQVMLVLQNTPQENLELPGLTLSPEPVNPGATQLDLTLFATEGADGLALTLRYRADLFDGEAAERMLGHYGRLLEAAAADPALPLSRLRMLDAEERRQLLEDWNDTAADFPSEATIGLLFEEQAARTPNQTALSGIGGRITYAELNRRANQLARHLRGLGVGPGVVVGVCLERSFKTVIALLGVLKAGGAYLPLDAADPAERLRLMLEDAQAPLLLAQERTAGRVPPDGRRVLLLDSGWAEVARESDANLTPSATAEDAAYVVYVSGSEGGPRGVVATHRAAVNRLQWMWERYPFAAGELCCQKTPLGSVDAVWEIFGPLLRGVPTLLLREELSRDAEWLVEALGEKRVTRLVAGPSLLREMLGVGGGLSGRLRALKVCVSTGEALPAELARRFQEAVPHAALVNLYGCSEVVAAATACEAVADDARAGLVQIGRPIANTRAYVLDRRLRPAPVGVPGELYVGGASLARGYLNRPALTAERFVPNPYSSEPGARLYRTGDLARYLPDGSLEYLGRADRQLKVRGRRVEPGEVEAALRLHAQVRDCFVNVRGEGAGGEGRLVAYVVPGEDAPAPDELRAFAGERLPEHMVPAAFVLLGELPLTPDGKVDRRALPDPSAVAQPHREYLGPQTETEVEVARVWSELLRVERPDVRDNFFDAGGHSLLATQLLSRLRAAFGVDLTLKEFFAAPTIRGLAEKVLETRLLSLDAARVEEVLRLSETMGEEELARLLGGGDATLP